VLAQSKEVNDQYKYLRTYPEGDLFGPVTGYFNISFGAAGVEQQYNEELAGRTAKQQFRTLSDLFVKKDRSGNATLTIRKDVQQVARVALGDRNGSVVVLDPKTGDVLAMWSYPSYDPNPLSVHGKDPKLAQDATNRKVLLDHVAGQPLLARAYRQVFYPGSTFKVVTGSVGVESGKVTPDQPVYPQLDGLVLPQTKSLKLRNYGGEVCGGALFDILKVSCNSSFAQMGLDLGGPTMITGAEAFGFNNPPPIDLPGPAKSVFPTVDYNRQLGSLAQASIGQFDVKATPLQMALVAATIANHGKTMTPHLLKDIRDGDGNVVKEYKAKPWRTPISDQTATTMRQAMLGVVQDGTATGLQIDGHEVAGKTGTAELGSNPPTNHAWIIGFAGKPNADPEVAVAVLVEGQPGVASEQTGGQVAAPIAKTVMQKVLQIKEGG